MKRAFLVVRSLVAFAVALPAMAQQTESGRNVEERLDEIGDRINDRLDRRGEFINERMDHRGEVINEGLDRKAEVAREVGKEGLANRLDRRGNRIGRHLVRCSRTVDNRSGRRARTVNHRVRRGR